MRIAYLIDVRLTDGGAPISSHILAKEMAKNNNEVYVIMPECENREDEVLNVNYIHLEKFQNRIPFDVLHPIKFIKFIIELKKIIEKISPDIIHAEMPRSGRAIAILKQLNMINSKTKLVFTDREYVVDLKRRYKKMYEYTISRQYNMVVSLSDSSTLFWEKTLTNGQVVVIPNPGGMPYDVYSEKEYNDSKKRYKELSNGKINIIFVGRMTWEKRWELSKKVLLGLNKKFVEKINIILVFSFSDSNQEKEIDDFILDIKNEKNIFIYKNLHADQLSSLYYLADIHCITSCRESFGRTAIEAMSRKTVVITTDGGAIKETVGRKEFVVDDDPNKIICSLSKYICNQELLEKEKNNFYEYYQNKFTTDTNYRKHIDLYNQLLKDYSYDKYRDE